MSSNKKAPRKQGIKTSVKRINKVKIFAAQKLKFFRYLQRHTVTCSMVSRAIRVPQKNLTCYKREYERTGLLKEVCCSVCKLTGFRAAYLSTNPDLFKRKNAKP
jgi:hypothetical protein